jgi:hypothetical protein
VVPFQIYVWYFRPLTKMAATAELNLTFIKVWFQLSNWFQTRRFLCKFPIGSYVKLSSAVGAILVEGPNRRTHFFQNYVWYFRPLTKMAATAELNLT